MLIWQFERGEDGGVWGTAGGALSGAWPGSPVGGAEVAEEVGLPVEG